MRQREIECPRDTWVTLIFDFGKGYSEEYKILFETPDGEPVSGRYEEHQFFWICPQAVTRGKLENRMNFRRYWINGIYKVKVCTTTDTIAYVKGRMRFKVLFLILVLILGLCVLITSLI